MHISTIAVRIVVLCLSGFLSAFFSGAETAFFSLRVDDLKGLRNSGKVIHRVLLDMKERPTHLLTTIVFSNMVVNLLFFSTSYLLIHQYREVLPSYLSFSLAAGSLLFVILFCEVIPKNLAVPFARQFSVIAAYPLFILQKISWPVLIPLERFTSFSSRFITEKLPEPPQLTEKELETLIELSETEGILEEDIGEMIAEIIELSDIAVREIAIPRVDMTCFPVSWPQDKIEKLFKESKHSLLPVYKDSMDKMLGVVHIRDFFFRDPDNFNIEDIIQKIPYLPESASAEVALHKMRTQQCHMVFVINEYGALEGVLTIEDIAEEIVGSIGDEYDESDRPPPVQKLGNSRYRLRGDLSIRKWKEAFPISDSLELPADTVGGFVTALLGKIPAANDTITYKNIHFTVESVQGRRIKYLRINLLPHTANSEEPHQW